MRLVQHVSKDKWAKYEPVLMALADSTAVARQVKTPIFSKLSTLETACLALRVRELIDLAPLRRSESPPPCYRTQARRR